MAGYEAKAIVRRLFDEAWNQNKVAELDEYTPAPRDRGAAGRANRPSGECAQSRRQRPHTPRPLGAPSAVPHPAADARDLAISDVICCLGLIGASSSS
jgi:hypothetical protein